MNYVILQNTVVCVFLVFLSMPVASARNDAKIAAYGRTAVSAYNAASTYGALKKFMGNTMDEIGKTIKGEQSVRQMEKNVSGKRGTVDELITDLTPGMGLIRKGADLAENAKRLFRNAFKNVGRTAQETPDDREYTGTAAHKYAPGRSRNVRNSGHDDPFTHATKEESVEKYAAVDPYDPWAPTQAEQEAADPFHGWDIDRNRVNLSGEDFDSDDTGPATPNLKPTFETPFGAAADGSASYNVTVGEDNILAFPGATGGDGALAYTVNPGLPAGLAFDAASRTIEGRLRTGATRQTYVLTATDADGDTDTLTFHIVPQMNPEKRDRLLNNAIAGLKTQAAHKQEVLMGYAPEHQRNRRIVRRIPPIEDEGNMHGMRDSQHSSDVHASTGNCDSPSQKQLEEKARCSSLEKTFKAWAAPLEREDYTHQPCRAMAALAKFQFGAARANELCVDLIDDPVLKRCLISSVEILKSEAYSNARKAAGIGGCFNESQLSTLRLPF